MKVFVDDIRTPPIGFVLFKDSKSAVEYITTYWDEIDEISLDHDLGDEELCGSGYQIVCEMEDFVFNTRPRHVPHIHVHSSNPVGRKRMEYAIRNIEQMVNHSLL